MRKPAPTPISLPTAGRVPSGRVTGRLTAMLAVMVLLAGCAFGGTLGGAAPGRPPGGPAADPADAAAGGSAESAVPGLDTGASARRPARFRASGVLAAWDRARARAFADGDSDALRALYLPRSAAGTSDLALLRAYRARGLRVEGMRMQLLAVEVLHETPRLLRLRVTDRLAGAVAVGQGTRIPLPRDHASTRVVELRRSSSGRWRMAWVREGAGAGREDSLRASERPPAGR